MNVITVAAAVILNGENQLLLVRKKNTQFFMQNVIHLSTAYHHLYILFKKNKK